MAPRKHKAKAKPKLFPIFRMSRSAPQVASDVKRALYLSSWSATREDSYGNSKGDADNNHKEDVLTGIGYTEQLIDVISSIDTKPSPEYIWVSSDGVQPSKAFDYAAFDDGDAEAGGAFSFAAGTAAFDDGESSTFFASFPNLIPLECLHDSRLSLQDVLDDLRLLLPELHPDNNKDMAAFLQNIRSRTYDTATYRPYTGFWDDCEENEPLFSAAPDKGLLNMDPAYITKPWGSLKEILAVMMSFPSMDSTQQARYGSWRDISNPCVAYVLAKMGYEHPQHFGRQWAILGFDLLSRQFDWMSEASKSILKFWPGYLKRYLLESGLLIGNNRIVVDDLPT
ncbi:hypothetical protein NX059_006137 [Plenodomus lindquistii]|nr:hypothetical protein NX059_006137 [Plenodomus lindquistii]